MTKINLDFIPQNVQTFLAHVKHEGGQAFIVGGAVRDRLLGIEPHDLDIEIHSMDTAVLKSIAEAHAEVIENGSNFTILKLQFPNMQGTVDISVPRREHSTGHGHVDFDFAAAPFIGIREAAKRRDFTINAIAAEFPTGNIVDPFNGARDLQAGILRAVNPTTFLDDPLRILRAAQFVSRFGVIPDQFTMTLLHRGTPKMVHLSHGRFLEEWRKLLLGKFPGDGVDLLQKVGVLGVLHPELGRLEGTTQDPEWHPEGTAFTHTKLTLDAMVPMASVEDDNEAFMLMLAALLHDVGKPLVTGENHDHAEAGVAPARSFMESIGVPHGMQDKVAKLVEWHMSLHTTYPNATNAAFRRLARRLHPATVRELALLTHADTNGRGQFAEQGIEKLRWALEHAETFGVLEERPKPVVTGQELLDRGMAPGRMVGLVMREAEALLDDGMSPEEVREKTFESVRQLVDSAATQG